MNTIWIVMPILIILMFLLGIDITKKAFKDMVATSKSAYIKSDSIVLAIFSGSISSGLISPIQSKNVNTSAQYARIVWDEKFFSLFK